MKTVRGRLTHAFNDIRLEEVQYPELRAGWEIVKAKAVQPPVMTVFTQPTLGGPVRGVAEAMK